MKKIYAMVTGLALGLGVLMGSASAGEKFALLENIPAQAMSQSEMAAVEGKDVFVPFNYWPSYLGYQTIRPGILPYAVYQYLLSSRTAPYYVAMALNPWGVARGNRVCPNGFTVGC